MTAAWEDVLECIRTAEGMARISAEYVKSLTFNKERMENILNNGFSNATEIADSLVLQGGLSFRQAHKVVGAAVSRLFEQKLGQEALTWELLDEYCRSINGVPLPITPEQVRQAKDFRVCVERRNCQGSTSRDQVQRMLEQQYAERDAAVEAVAKHRKKWKDASAKLHSAANI